MKKDDKTNVMRLLDQKRIAYAAHTYEPDATKSGEEIAEILREDPDKVYKTLVTQGKTGQYYVFLLGASGAIYAVLFAYAVVFPRSIIYIWGFIPLPAPVMVVVYALIELGSQFFKADNVAHLTHLFGFLSAWLYFVIRMGIHPVKIWKKTYR